MSPVARTVGSQGPSARPAESAGNPPRPPESGDPADQAASAALTRRQFLLGATALAGATVLVVGCGGAAVPVAASAGPSPTPSRWIRIPTAGLVADEPRWVTFDSSPGASPVPVVADPGATAGATSSALAGAWLVLQTDGSVLAFMPGCTHQRCLYDWDVAAARFQCRCHAGSFAPDGRVMDGPPPRPLDRYPVRRESPDAVDIGWLDRA